uniref:Uncharacterized protein n=1 Tax=Glossina palpalis gambiensis TaxID=67801 RepID=A0A1B0B4K9_9MUSC
MTRLMEEDKAGAQGLSADGRESTYGSLFKSVNQFCMIILTRMSEKKRSVQIGSVFFSQLIFPIIWAAKSSDFNVERKPFVISDKLMSLLFVSSLTALLSYFTGIHEANADI